MEFLTSLIDIVLHLDKHLQALIATHGTWVYLILFLIIFCETGLVVAPFLPGDSLLFVAGAIAAKLDDPAAALGAAQSVKARVAAQFSQNAMVDGILAAYRRQYPRESPFGLWAAISAAGPRQNSITQAERKAAQGGAPGPVGARIVHRDGAWRLQDAG